MGGACSMYVRDEKIHIVFWSEELKGLSHSEDLGINGKIIRELILGKEGAKMWIGFIWLRIWISGGFL
jgi:hypothetical protein